jgi:hypothetical protein
VTRYYREVWCRLGATRMGIRELPWNLGSKSKSPGDIRIEDNFSSKLHRLGQRSEPDPENPRTDQNRQTAIRPALFKYDYPRGRVRRPKIPKRTKVKNNLAIKSESYPPIMITRRSTHPLRDPICTTNIPIFPEEITKLRRPCRLEPHSLQTP